MHSVEEIKVLHFARSRDQIDSLISDDMEDSGYNQADGENKQPVAKIFGDNSFSDSKKASNTFGHQLKIFPLSLQNSLKKNTLLQSSEKHQEQTSARSFTDVLNAMRDTEVIEKEKR